MDFEMVTGFGLVEQLLEVLLDDPGVLVQE